MTNKKAISVLETHRDILLPDSYRNLFLWKTGSLSYIERFLGKDSEQYKLIESFRSFPDPREREYDVKMDAIKSAMISTINQTIETVKNIGIKREYHNFLCKYSDKEIIAGIIAVVGAIVTATVFIVNWSNNHLNL